MIDHWPNACSALDCRSRPIAAEVDVVSIAGIVGLNCTRTELAAQCRPGSQVARDISAHKSFLHHAHSPEPALDSGRTAQAGT